MGVMNFEMRFFFLAVSFVFSEKRIGGGGKLCVYTIDFML